MIGPARTAPATCAALARLGLCLALLAGVLLTGCKSLGLQNGASANEAGKLTGGLLVIRLLDRTDPPRALAIDLTVEGQTQPISISGRLQRSVPGKFADYFIPLALPTGNYVLRQVRSLKPELASASSLLATLNLPWVNAKPEPVYLGRMTIQMLDRPASRGDIAVESHFEEDTVAFRTAVPELRTARVTEDLLSSQLLSSAAPVAAYEQAGFMDVIPIDARAGAALAEPARSAFARYLKLKMPRAFAVNKTGAFGYAEGRDAIAAAMYRCVRFERSLKKAAEAQGKTPLPDCELMSVDQTLLTSESCKAALTNASDAAGPRAGCQPARGRRQ